MTLSVARASRAAVLGALLVVHAPLASAASPAGWLDYLNSFRACAGLPQVTEDPALSRAGRDHSVYLVKNEVLQHGETPGNPWYTSEGQAAAAQSNLFASDDRGDSDCFVLDTWMQSPFHAVGILDPRLARVGYGSYREAHGGVETGAALNVIAGVRDRAAVAYPVFWPGNGATATLSRHQGGYPNPLSSCPGYTVPSGIPLIVQLGPGDLTPAVTATSLSRDGQPLEHCVFDETSYRNPDGAQQQVGRSILGARDAIVIIPRAPLTPGGTYTASVTANGQTLAWTFGISGAAPTREDPSLSRFARFAE